MDDPGSRGGAAATAAAVEETREAASAFEQGVRALEAGDPARAAALLDRAAALRPDRPEIWAELAAASLRLGRAAAARQQARAALRLGLDDGRIRTVLGLALRMLGRLDESLEALEVAAGQSPDFAGTRLNLGDALALLGRHDEAGAAYEEATRIDPGLAVAHARLGTVLVRQQRLRDAFRAFTRAVEIDPRHHDAWRALAELHAAVEDYAPAIDCWRRYIALAPRVTAADRRGLGWAYQEENRLEEAEAAFREAIALEPDAPDARVDLGFLLEEKGDLAAAEAAFREAIAIDPGYTLASARLASMLRRSLPDDDLERTRRLLEDPATPEPARCPLHYSLGHVHDARGDYATAARHLREANRLQLEHAPPHRRFDPDEHLRFIDDLIRNFDADFFARVAGAGLDTRRPVFIVGLPRSGTSLVEQVLASHPDVHGAGELSLGRRLFANLPAIVGAQTTPAGSLPQLDRPTIRRLAVAYLERLDAIAGTRHARVVDKMPDNVMFLGILVTIFPAATVIHCRRDLRDVALSCWTSDFRSLFWCNDFGHIAARFRGYLRLLEHWRAVLPTPIVDVSYEEFVHDLEGNARRLLDAMGLDWHPDCLEFHRTNRPVRTSSATQVRQPLYTRSVGRWRHYQDHLAPLFAALPQQLGQHGDGGVIGKSS